MVLLPLISAALTVEYASLQTHLNRLNNRLSLKVLRRRFSVFVLVRRNHAIHRIITIMYLLGNQKPIGVSISSMLKNLKHVE